jgi:Kef-type K+ transport system membrane component KefB
MAITEVGQILQDFSVIMIIAGAMAMLSWRFKQPLVVGYHLPHISSEFRLQ